MSGFALVELFTSEGCSSCPPADDVLAGLAQRRAAGEAIFTLGFHVDYWDHLGWVEPFGSPQWTRRQHGYADTFRSRGLYTPQAVVNGTAETVGSRERQVRRAVATALRAPAFNLTASVFVRDGTVLITGGYLDAKPTSGTEMVAALVQQRGHSDVKRGENAGRTLNHVDIVRALGTAAPNDPITLQLPADIEPDRLSVILLAQHTSSMAVLGATQIPLTLAA